MQIQNNILDKRIHSTQNIAVQTDMENRVNSQLRAVDADIAIRLHNFETDLRSMREKLAQALREKEELLRKLAKLEDKPRRQIEEELKQSTSSWPTLPFPKTNNLHMNQEFKPRKATVICNESWS